MYLKGILGRSTHEEGEASSCQQQRIRGWFREGWREEGVGQGGARLCISCMHSGR